jgi:hypothetical protein
MNVCVCQPTGPAANRARTSRHGPKRSSGRLGGLASPPKRQNALRGQSPKFHHKCAERRQNLTFERT